MQNLNRKLVEIRFTEINATIGPGAGKPRGGTVKIEVTLGVVDGPDNQALATVEMNVKGIPKESSDDAFAFSVSIGCSGLWEWTDKKPSPQELQTECMTHELCSSVHTLVVSEVSRLTLSLGFPGVKIPWAISEASQPDLQKIASATKKPRLSRKPKQVKEN
jgi:hypothetical protein